MKPFVMATAPLAVVDKDPLFIKVNLFNRRWVPEKHRARGQSCVSESLKINCDKLTLFSVLV